MSHLCRFPDKPKSRESATGLALSRQGKVEVAIVCLERALQLKPDYAEAAYNLSLPRVVRWGFSAGLRTYERRSGVSVKQHRPARRSTYEKANALLAHQSQATNQLKRKRRTN